MGKKNKKIKNISKNEKPIDIQAPVKMAKTKPSYIFGVVYFIFIASFSYFVLYLQNNKYTNLITTLLFLLYFVFVFLISKKNNNSTQTSIIIPIKLLLIILGISFFVEFSTTGISYINEANIHSQNLFDIEKYSEKITETKEYSIYADIENQKMFLISSKKDGNVISEFQMLDEDSFNREIVQNTHTFFNITDNLRFSYIVNNRENKVLMQWTKNDKRYLSMVDSTLLINTLKEKDSYDKPIFNNGELELYQIEYPGLILAYTDDFVQVSEYDTLDKIKNTSYIDRVYTFLKNHYEEEYISKENASGELLAEYIDDSMKLNLYSISCASCQYKYGKSDIAEIIKEDQSYIFNLDINSNLIKEGK